MSPKGVLKNKRLGYHRGTTCQGHITLEVKWMNICSWTYTLFLRCLPLQGTVTLKPKILTLWRLLLPYGMGAAINHPVPDRLKPLFVIFDIWALWHSGLKEKGLRPFELFASVDDDGSLLRHSWYRWWVSLHMCMYVCLGSRRSLWVNPATFTSPAVRLCTRAVMFYRVILFIQLSIRHRMCLVLSDYWPAAAFLHRLMWRFQLRQLYTAISKPTVRLCFTSLSSDSKAVTVCSR